MQERWTIQSIRNAVIKGTLAELFSSSEVNQILNITYAETFLPKHRAGNPGANTELFVQGSYRPARYRLR